MFSHFPFHVWLATAILSLRTIEAALAPPGCQTVAPLQNTLSNVRTAQLNVSASPFGIMYGQQQDVAFVTLNDTLGVLNTSTFPLSLAHQIPLPAASDGALGLTLTHNERYVLVAAGPGLFVLDTALAVGGSANAVVGVLNGTIGTQTPGDEAIEVTLSLNDKYAFVSQELGSDLGVTPGNIDVFKLHKPAANGSVFGTAIGYLNLGFDVVGTVLSPNGRTLYALSEAVSRNASQGSISVIDVKTLETNPSAALVSNATAGCGPVRTILSSDGKTIWVTARESNHLLAFDAAKLVSDPNEALLASVQVGTSPVGLTFARNESRILTADSNRFGFPNATTGLSVVDVQAALAGNPAVLGRVPTGLFPRELAVSPDGSVILVADFTSKQIQAVDVATLP